MAERIREQQYDIYVTDDLEAAKEYVREPYRKQEDARYGLLASSRVDLHNAELTFLRTATYDTITSDCDSIPEIHVGEVMESANRMSGALAWFLDRFSEERLGNPPEPVDDLVYLLISNRTTIGVAKRVYQDLKTRFQPWDELLEPWSLQPALNMLHPAGLAELRLRNICGSLRRIREDFDSMDLRELSYASVGDALGYLESLPGVSVKVAKCVMLFTLGFEVLPVDTHVHRVGSRLGLTNKKRPLSAAKEIEEQIEPRLRYAFHVGAIVLGRSVCGRRPDCDACGIEPWCNWVIDDT